MRTPIFAVDWEKVHQKDSKARFTRLAMCVNDLLAQGAEPMLFLDYFATGKLHVEAAAQVLLEPVTPFFIRVSIGKEHFEFACHARLLSRPSFR